MTMTATGIQWLRVSVGMSCANCCRNVEHVVSRVSVTLGRAAARAGSASMQKRMRSAVPDIRARWQAGQRGRWTEGQGRGGRAEGQGRGTEGQGRGDRMAGQGRQRGRGAEGQGRAGQTEGQGRLLRTQRGILLAQQTRLGLVAHDAGLAEPRPQLVVGIEQQRKLTSARPGKQWYRVRAAQKIQHSKQLLRRHARKHGGGWLPLTRKQSCPHLPPARRTTVSTRAQIKARHETHRRQRCGVNKSTSAADGISVLERIVGVGPRIVCRGQQRPVQRL